MLHPLEPWHGYALKIESMRIRTNSVVNCTMPYSLWGTQINDSFTDTAIKKVKIRLNFYEKPMKN